MEGRELKISSAKTHKGFLIAKLEGIDDVNAAMSLKGKTACILRSDAKLPKGSYFIQDIIGAKSWISRAGRLAGSPKSWSAPPPIFMWCRGRKNISFPLYRNLLCQPIRRWG
ncbi:MAG: hypothetical protein V8T45_04615 [Oscillospiraceae bacterium]